MNSERIRQVAVIVTLLGVGWAAVLALAVGREAAMLALMVASVALVIFAGFHDPDADAEPDG